MARRFPEGSPAVNAPGRPVRVAVIGGLTRVARDWERAGGAIGAVVEHHDGRTAGARAEALAAIVRRADIVVAILVPNSHGAVAIARRAAQSHHRVFRLVKHLRPSALGEVIAGALGDDSAPPAIAAA